MLRIPPPAAAAYRPPMASGTVVRFPWPFRWFQQRLWRLKWLEVITLVLIASACMVAGIGEQRPLTVGQGLTMAASSPLVGLYFLLMLKAIAFMLCCIPPLTGPTRWCLYGHDRLLSRICEQPIGWVKDY